MKFPAILAAWAVGFGWSALPCLAAVAIQDVTVIDVASGAVRPHVTVILNGDKITAVIPASAAVPAGLLKDARVVDGQGKFLMPGLWDMHVHLWSQQNQLPVFLAFGVTSVRDMGSDFKRLEAWRDEIDGGRAVGPRIVTGGPAVDGDAPVDTRFPAIAVHSPVEARQAFDQLFDLNVDFIRVLPGLSRDAYFALAEQARHWDLGLSGEIPPSIAAWEAVEARQRSLEHMSGIPNSVSDDAAALECFELCAKYGVRISPMLTWWRRMAHLDEASLKGDRRFQYVPASTRATWSDLPETESREASAAQVDSVYRLVGLAQRTKVELLAGTDTGSPYTIPGASLQDELQEMVRAGLTPRDALQAATLAPARFFGWEHAMGSIEKGKIADAVLLDANPLVNIANVRKIAAVFSHGKYYSRQDLDGILARVK